MVLWQPRQTTQGRPCIQPLQDEMHDDCDRRLH